MRWTHFWLGVGALVLGSAVLATSQTANNPQLGAAVCAYNSSPPTGTSGTFILVQCDSTGKLMIK